MEKKQSGGFSGSLGFVFAAAGADAAQDGYFAGFITSPVGSIAFMLLFLAVTAIVVYCGVEKGIEKFSSIAMPWLLVMIVGIGVFSLTLRHEGRTGLQGLGVYLIPDFSGMTFTRFLQILLDAMSQLFFSLSVSMGIMITYGSYVKKEVNLGKAISQIEFFDTGVALLAGLMVIPAVYVFSGTEGMASGPNLMFVSLPKVFQAMGSIGSIVGLVFFVMVAFAALTSCVSVMETLVAGVMEIFGAGRKKLYGIMIRYIAPVIMAVLFVQSTGLLS